jgi:hypothetical protein
MKFRLIHRQTSHNTQSPFRVVEHTTERELAWINRYLDREYVRRLANTTLRTYAYNLLHFVRWITPTTFGKITLASPRCWSMCASSPVNHAGLPLPSSMTVSPSPIGPFTTSSPRLPARSPAVFIKLFCGAGLWVWDVRGWL